MSSLVAFIVIASLLVSYPVFMHTFFVGLKDAQNYVDPFITVTLVGR